MKLAKVRQVDGRMAVALIEGDTVAILAVILLTGTGIVPGDDFTLAAGGVVNISIAGIGTLSNPVVQAG